MATAARAIRLNDAPPTPRLDARPSASERGYDGAWKRLRDAFLQQSPLCAACRWKGRVTPATEVDHVIPFDSPNDPLRLDWHNLQSLCHPCHQRKTAIDKRDTSDAPVVCIVTGPPGCGKTTYVNRHRRQGDFVYDMDTIGAAVGAPEWGTYSGRPDDVARVLLDWRDALIEAIRSGKLQRRAWLIVSDARTAERIAKRIGPTAHVRSIGAVATLAVQEDAT